MKYLKKYSLFENERSNNLTEEQRKFLGKYVTGSWKFDISTGLVNIDGNFNCKDRNIDSFLDINFGNVSGDFYCSGNNLVSLEGCPKKVGVHFDCGFNKLTNLFGAPEEVGGSFTCSYNKLKSLEGGPGKVGKIYSCSNNELISIEGAPKEIGESFHIHKNPVSQATFLTIYDKMKEGYNYPIVLTMVKREIPKDDWEKLDKSSMDKLDSKTISGVNILGKLT